MGLTRFELVTPSLSEKCSNQLSYSPDRHIKEEKRAWRHYCRIFNRKEVIQPHLPVRLPCYDFTPLTGRTFGTVPLAVRQATSGTSNSDGVTGGVYKTRERIHRAMLMRDY